MPARRTQMCIRMHFDCGYPPIPLSGPSNPSVALHCTCCTVRFMQRTSRICTCGRPLPLLRGARRSCRRSGETSSPSCMYAPASYLACSVCCPIRSRQRCAEAGTIFRWGHVRSLLVQHRANVADGRHSGAVANCAWPSYHPERRRSSCAVLQQPMGTRCTVGPAVCRLL